MAYTLNFFLDLYCEKRTIIILISWLILGIDSPPLEVPLKIEPSCHELFSQLYLNLKQVKHDFLARCRMSDPLKTASAPAQIVVNSRVC